MSAPLAPPNRKYGIPPVPQTMQNTLASDLICRPEYMGGTPLLQPFVQGCASQRSMMAASHLTQSMVLDHAEQPRIMTGYEKIFGQYEFTTCRVAQGMTVVADIPKFNPMTFNKIGIGNMPSRLIVYVGDKDKKVHCMEVSTYTLLSENFGYFNKMPGVEKGLLQPGSYIPKGTKLTTSPAHDGNRYGMGINANVAFMGEWGVTEDAFIVSRSLAEKGLNTAINQVRLDIDPKTVPLNLYGDDTEHQCFPKIGDTVRYDGSLIAIRKVNPSTFVTDMTPERLKVIERIHDETHLATPGSEIIDVEVFINEDAVRKMDSDKTLYQQFFDIAECRKYQYDQIISVYEQLCVKDGYECGDDFSTQVVRAAILSNNKKYVKKHIKLCDGREPIEFIKVIITYAKKRKITVGSKLTGREGGKGVVSSIWEDEDMPVDDNGVRADIIMTPASTINRMNPSQMFEQFWNRMGLQVLRNIRDKYLGGWKESEGKIVNWVDDMRFRKNWKAMYAYIVDFFHDFRPAYAQFINETIQTEDDRMEFVEDCLNDGLYLINAFRDPITPEHIVAMKNKYGDPRTPVTYRVKDTVTGQKKTIRTLLPVLIGSKYLLVLGKLPSSYISAIEMGHVNQFEGPIKPKSKHVKSQAIIGLTPQKFGKQICRFPLMRRVDKNVNCWDIPRGQSAAKAA